MEETVNRTVTKAEYNDILDFVESQMLCEEQTECQLRHFFTKGVYCREITVPAGTTVVTEIHNTEHPFIMSKGRCLVTENGMEMVELEAPYFGITLPNTRRLIEVIEETVWTTIHPTEITPKSDSEEDMLEAVAKIKEIIIKPHVNKYVLENKKEEILWLG